MSVGASVNLAVTLPLQLPLPRGDVPVRSIVILALGHDKCNRDWEPLGPRLRCDRALLRINGA